MLRLDKALFIALVVVILAALGGIIYLAAVPQPDEKFTEFYILGSQGKAADYPQQVMPGEEVELTVGVVNHEYQPAAYRVEITINGTSSEEINVGTLAHEQKWERAVSFVAPSAGDNQTVEFWLYKDNQLEPYLEDPLRLYIDVRQPDEG
jgi:uncharacterized membrane protein